MMLTLQIIKNSKLISFQSSKSLKNKITVSCLNTTYGSITSRWNLSAAGMEKLCLKAPYALAVTLHIITFTTTMAVKVNLSVRFATKPLSTAKKRLHRCFLPALTAIMHFNPKRIENISLFINALTQNAPIILTILKSYHLLCHNPKDININYTTFIVNLTSTSSRWI